VTVSGAGFNKFPDAPVFSPADSRNDPLAEAFACAGQRGGTLVLWNGGVNVWILESPDAERVFMVCDYDDGRIKAYPASDSIGKEFFAIGDCRTPKNCRASWTIRGRRRRRTRRRLIRFFTARQSPTKSSRRTMPFAGPGRLTWGERAGAGRRFASPHFVAAGEDFSGTADFPGGLISQSRLARRLRVRSERSQRASAAPATRNAIFCVQKGQVAV